MNTKLKVENGIPIPENTRLKAHGKYPFHLLRKIGQSMFIPRDYATTQQVSAAAFAYRKRNPKFKYTVRTIGKGACRIWRI